MRGRTGQRAGVLAAMLVFALGAPPLGAAPLTETGRRAYETARKADDEAAAASEEGAKTLTLIKALVPEREAVPPTLKPFLELTYRRREPRISGRSSEKTPLNGS